MQTFESNERARPRPGNRITVWAILGFAALIAACSGGGGGESSSTAAAQSAVSTGPIAGFGSVIVNGVRWNTDDAAFEIDGRPGRQDDLALGMVVRVEGDRGAPGQARADRVVFESRLRGPVRAIEELGPDARALEIFGLRALVSRASTRFEGVTLEGLDLDTVVELSGFVNEVGELEATFLRRRAPAIVGVTEVKVFGAVDGLAGGSFVLGTSEILFDDATVVDDLDLPGLRDGLEVRVEGILLANDAISATEIEGPRGRGDDDFGEVEIHGIVTDFVAIDDFRVDGRAVDASRATFEPNDPALLRDGARVEVEGRVSATGVLVAEKVKFRANRVEIEAELASADDVDVALGRIWLLDIPIDVDDATELRDDFGRDDALTLDDLEAGDFLALRGLLRSDGRVVATRLRREDPDDLELRGPVESVDAGARTLVVLGVPVQTDAGTRFALDDDVPLDAAAFFDRVRPGDVVKIEDRQDGDETDLDVADEVELERPDPDDDDDGDESDDDRDETDDSDDGDRDDSDSSDDD